jgi:hypothetical protein
MVLARQAAVAIFSYSTPGLMHVIFLCDLQQFIIEDLFKHRASTERRYNVQRFPKLTRYTILVYKYQITRIRSRTAVGSETSL